MAKTRPFEKYSNEYDKWFEENSELYEAELEAIRQVLRSGSRVRQIRCTTWNKDRC